MSKQNHLLPTTALLTAILFAGFALRVAYLTTDRFHADEALYAGWALSILNGDLYLASVPIDKPPLYLCTLAMSIASFGPSEFAARLPNLAASMLTIALVYCLGRRLYNRNVAIWAALFVALCPFDILFARTAFTDPLLVLWTLAALVAVAANRWFAAGLAMGLAFATKQHALLLVPWVVGVGLVCSLRSHSEGSDRGNMKVAWHSAWCVLTAGLGFAIPFGLVTAWDSVRWDSRPGYWQQSAMSYGGLSWAATAEWRERFISWLSWARYLTGSPVLNALLLGGSLYLLANGWYRHPGTRQTWLDTVLVAYALGYLGVHTILHFSIWDRYLLPLSPLVALLLARATTCLNAYLAHRLPKRLPSQVLLSPGSRLFPALYRILCLLAVPLVCLPAALGAWKAAHNGYPIGGEHWAYQGLDQVVAYLKQNAPANAVLYHHWLRWHYTYYLHDTDFELRWWESGDHLYREAKRTPDRTQYIVLPDWRTLEPDTEGLSLHLVYEAHRQDGSVSLGVYRIEIKEVERSGSQDATGGNPVSNLHLTKKLPQHTMIRRHSRSPAVAFQAVGRSMIQSEPGLLDGYRRKVSFLTDIWSRMASPCADSRSSGAVHHRIARYNVSRHRPDLG